MLNYEADGLRLKSYTHPSDRFMVSPPQLEEVISVLRPELESLRRQFAVDRLSIFGSVARGQARPDSDIDISVRFRSAEDFDRYMDLKLRLEELLGLRVDLVSEDAIRREFKEFVDREAVCVS
jgi:uncharacterized protein